MGKLTVTCANCGMRTALRDNGFERPPRPSRCPFCGSGDLRRETEPGPRKERPQEAA
jgi:hypothetical protein